MWQETKQWMDRENMGTSMIGAAEAGDAPQFLFTVSLKGTIVCPGVQTHPELRNRIFCLVPAIFALGLFILG
jgi:hypothetical protein